MSDPSSGVARHAWRIHQRPSGIHLPAGLLETAKAHDEALAIVREILDRPLIAAMFAGAPAITGELLGGGRSDAHVLKLSAPDTPPIILKIGTGPDGEIERANYERFARDMLPRDRRPELLAFVQRGALAGLCFEWAGGAGRKADSFTRRLQARDGEVIDRFVRMLLPELARGWYGADQLMTERDLAQRYREHYFSKPPGIACNEATLRGHATRFFGSGVDGPSFRVGGEVFPMPQATLFETPPRLYRSCIVHGDLNTDNLLIAAPGNGIKLVDFRKTGRGHVFEDLVALEHSVRINHPKDAAIDRLLQIEGDIADASLGAGAPPYALCIGQLRRAAMTQFGDVEPISNYHYAVAAIGLRLMQATDLTEVAQARITASIMWAAWAVVESAAD